MGEKRTLPFDATDPRLAAAAWSRIAEPGDEAAGLLVSCLGTVAALDWLTSGAHAVPGVAAGPFAEVPGAAGEAGTRGSRGQVGWERLRERWQPRLADLDPRRELDVLHRLGGRLLLPGDPEWPAGLDDLGVRRPHCLWVRGASGVAGGLDRSASVVGARACTAYGRHVAAELGAGLSERGVTVLSGGAYGIDAAAHQGALAAGGRTLAVLAGGVDRPYPLGNSELLAEVASSGNLAAEVPPGSAPTRSRFLQRNRLIAAMTGGTIVVEAAWRSGALSTASHAAALLRPVGAVPGPVTSAVSAGCHRLLREQLAVCVTDAAEVAELVGRLGADLADPVAGPKGASRTSRGAPPPGLEDRESRLYEALPLRAPSTVAKLARTAGLGEGEVRAALAYLELAGLVAREGSLWRRTATQ